MNKLLFKNAICKGYLIKNPEWKHVAINEEDETKEENGMILLGAGASFEQDKYIFKDTIFEGIIVGIYEINLKKEFCECYDDYCNRDFLHIDATSPTKIAKVYYANNKSRLVPVEKIEIWQSSF